MSFTESERREINSRTRVINVCIDKILDIDNSVIIKVGDSELYLEAGLVKDGTCRVETVEVDGVSWISEDNTDGMRDILNEEGMRHW